MESNNNIGDFDGIDGGPRAPATHTSLDRQQREIESLKRQLAENEKLLGYVSNDAELAEFLLATAIAEAAQKAGILNRDCQSLSGPQLLLLCDDLATMATAPVNLLLFCPNCGLQHIDAPNIEKAWDNPPHRSHECQRCFYTWRPSDRFTNGITAIDTAGAKDKSAKPRPRNFGGWGK